MLFSGGFVIFWFLRVHLSALGCCSTRGFSGLRGFGGGEVWLWVVGGVAEVFRYFGEGVFGTLGRCSFTAYLLRRCKAFGGISGFSGVRQVCVENLESRDKVEGV